jgi:putative aldouronate transport system substrate-binding protein
MFFSAENAKLWCLGVEGVTYTMQNGKVVFVDEIRKSSEGIYKSCRSSTAAAAM